MQNCRLSNWLRSSCFSLPNIVCQGSQTKPSKPLLLPNSKDDIEKDKPAPVKKKIDLNEIQTCRNKGCGKTFKEKDNHETACEYHPGPPVFHDRIRGVSLLHC